MSSHFVLLSILQFNAVLSIAFIVLPRVVLLDDLNFVLRNVDRSIGEPGFVILLDVLLDIWLNSYCILSICYLRRFICTARLKIVQGSGSVALLEDCAGHCDCCGFDVRGCGGC